MFHDVMMFHHGKIIGIMWHKNPGIGLFCVSGGTVGFKHQLVMNLGLSQDGIYYMFL
jgi:hypothetical protein